MSLLAQELASRGYDIEFLTRPPFNPGHRYAGWLARLGIPIHVLPRFEDFLIVKIGCTATAILLTLPYMILRRRSLKDSWQAASSIFMTRVARLERNYIHRRLARCARKNRRVALQIWGPAALAPMLLEWAEANGAAAIYHEMGEADEQYVETWHLEPTVESVNRARRLICCSRSVEESVRRVYGYEGKIVTIPFMIRDPGDKWAAALRNGRRVHFGAIGRLVPHKRHSDILQALKRLSDEGYDAGLVIAGDGPLRDQLKAMARDLGLGDRVTFTGEFDRLEDVMAQLDVFVLTSASESQCMPITESMSYGKPVVASDFGGIPDFVEDGVTGFLVPVGDVEELAAKLKRLLDDPALREEMGRRGRARYVERYKPERITDAFEETYGALWEERPATGLKLGYFVEDFSTFIVREIMELRKLGARITVFNAFRPQPETDPMKESLRRESLYFPPSYRGVAAANLLCLFRRPLTYIRQIFFLLGEGESLRMMVLAAYYARIIRREGIDHLHATFGTRTATLAYVTARLAGIDYSFTTHAYDIFNPNPSLVWKTDRALFMRTISQFNKQFIEENYAGIDGSKIQVGYLGVDTSEFAPAPKGEDRQSRISIMSVGDLFPKKGHAYLIRACDILSKRGIDFECKIAGRGFLHEDLQKEIESFGLTDRVDLLGAVKNEEVRRMVAMSHIFALACTDMRGQGEHIDGIPVVLMEAMAMGMAVVSTRISGIPELIEDGVSGLLVPEKDETALADAIQRLIEDAELRESLGRNARKQVEEHFDLKTNAKELVRLFEQAIGCDGK